MKLQRKIQGNMIIMIVISLLISFVATTIVLYTRNIEMIEAELKQEADYMIEAINIAGTDYFEELDSVRLTTRVTYIEEDGSVIYDQNKKAYDENHRERPEVIEAIAKGEGKDIRKSDTVGKEQMYYAVQMDNGNIFRVSKDMDDAIRTSLDVLPAIGIIIILMILVAWRVYKLQVKHIIDPINKIDIANPHKTEIYEELAPLIVNIDEHHKEKEAIANMRKEFTANVSHELKTPLTSISGYAEIMKNGLVKQEDIPEFSKRIYDESNRLVGIINDAIKLSKLDEDIALVHENMDLFEIARDTVTRLTPMGKKYNVRVEVRGESVMFNGVKNVIEDMVQNLVDNAIKYNVEDGSVSVWVGKTLSGIKLIVSDNGIGIRNEDKERVFERFYRADKSHSKEVEGTGLGLSIVKHAAQMHNINIQMESTVNEGTKIELTFPSL